MSNALDWTRIDTVLCDMDGTILDLGFDNYFWLEVVPREWGARRGMGVEEAQAELFPVFQQHRGSLDWYCLDFWTRKLGLNLRELKQQCASRIGYLPGVKDILQRLRESGLHLVLVTNAHPDSLDVKQQHTGLLEHFHSAHSTHSFGAPKEQPHFWGRFAAHTEIDLSRSLLIDDTESVLQGALDGGVGQVLAVRKPSLSHPEREPGSVFIELSTMAELILP